MKAGNVIFVIFMWIVLFPIILLLSIAGFFGSILGGSSSGTLCFIFLPIIFIVLSVIILLRPEKPPVVISNPPVENNYEYSHHHYKEPKKICPKCDTWIPEDSIICPYCGSKLYNHKGFEDGEQKDESLKILKIRYAKGEITKEEYYEMKKELEN